MLSTRWHNRWRPPQNVTTKIILIPGSYQGFEGEENEYFQYVEHFVKRSNKSFICSKQYQMVDGELTTIGGKCLGCQERDSGAEDISWSLKHAFNGVHLAWYHLEPVTDDNGKVRKYTKGKREGQEIMRKVECEGRRCKLCKEGLEKVFGKKIHWSLGAGHLNELAGYVAEIEKVCNTCGDGILDVVSYECANCGFPFIDMNTTDLDNKAIDNYIAHKRECPECQTTDYPMQQYECDKCKDPQSTSIFDCTLDIKRQGEGTNSTVQIPRWIVSGVPEELDENIDLSPYKFNKVFAPDPFDIQAKVLKIRNPFKDEEADKHSRDYGSDKEASDEEIPF